MLDFKAANAKLSVKINRALLLLIEWEKERDRAYILFIYSSLTKMMYLLKIYLGRALLDACVNSEKAMLKKCLYLLRLTDKTSQ